ncbi:MAG: hypothetical protein HY319_10445 [Armatimonadetes bacterium]|nr:hypothetical protein [Armatimonadota bacterium]
MSGGTVQRSRASRSPQRSAPTRTSSRAPAGRSRTAPARSPARNAAAPAARPAGAGTTARAKDTGAAAGAAGAAAAPASPAGAAAPPADRVETAPSSAAQTSPAGEATNRNLENAYGRINEPGAGKEKPAEAGGLLGEGGLLGLFNTARGAMTPFEFSAEERTQLQGARDTLSRLAGADGRWRPDDLARNLAQIQPDRSGRVAEAATRGVAYGRLTQGMEKMGQDVRGGQDADAHRKDTTGRAGEIRNQNPGTQELAKLERYTPEKLQQLRGNLETDEQRAQFDQQVAKIQARRQELTQQLGPQGLLPITTTQMRDFGDAMDMLEGKADAKGLPQGTFRQGMPVQFLDDVLNGARPLQLHRHRS